ncbi:MAG: c-type cytochrome [Myxococcales bacterium]|nr:c-type cytochrome [Myxococcales bacterium]
MSSEPLRKDEIQGQIVHVYDGIEEADNALPHWWLATFFGAILFAVFYWMFHETFPVADYPGETYAKASLAALNKGGPVTDKELMTLTEDAPMLATGKAIFMKECAACHGTKAEGIAGPNLTDEFWLYGGSPSEVFATITDGTPKGMPNWGPKLGKGATKQVTAYVLSLRNTNVAGKASQGEKWIAPTE